MTNYRLYGHETLQRLERIDKLKREKLSLEEIRLQMDQWGKVSSDELVTDHFDRLQRHFTQLEKEAKEVSSLIRTLKPHQVKNLFKILAPQGAACIEAIMHLLGESPLT